MLLWKNIKNDHRIIWIKKIKNNHRNRSSNIIKIGSIPADGIGKEVVPESQRVIKESLKCFSNSPIIEFIPLEAGWETFQKQGKALPEKTITTLKSCHGAIFGSVSSPSYKVEGYSSSIVQMRKLLDLYANLRPIISSPVKGSRNNIDMLIVRENTECLYIKKEKLQDNGKTAIAERLITYKASIRIAETAFNQAIKRLEIRKKLSNSKKNAKVTIVHKSNVLSITDGLFRECCFEVSKKFSNVEVEEQLVDSMIYKMILNPQYYDVVVAPNLYGDILSDAGAALVGGLGLIPSANVGDTFSMVEPVHGSGDRLNIIHYSFK
jgi:homoisocitrate dehydrogenase